DPMRIEAREVDAVAEHRHLRHGHTQPPKYRQVLLILEQLGVRRGRGEAFEAIYQRSLGEPVLGQRVEAVGGVYDYRPPRPASRPYTPGFGLCVCTIVGCSCRNRRINSNIAAASRCGAIERVECASGTCWMPLASSVATNGPGADTPITS